MDIWYLMCIYRFSSGIPACGQSKSDYTRWYNYSAQCGPLTGSWRTQHCSFGFWLGDWPCVLVWHKPRQNLEFLQKRQWQNCGEYFYFFWLLFWLNAPNLFFCFLVVYTYSNGICEMKNKNKSKWLIYSKCFGIRRVAGLSSSSSSSA